MHESVRHSRSEVSALRGFAISRGMDPSQAASVFRVRRDSARDGATTSELVARAEALGVGPEARAVLAMHGSIRENPGPTGWLRAGWDFVARSARIGAPVPITREKAAWVARFFEDRMGPGAGAHVVPVLDPQRGWMVEIRVAPRQERREALATFLGVPVRTTCPGERGNPGGSSDAVYIQFAPTVAQLRCPHRIRNRDQTECTVCGSIKRGNRWWYLREDWFRWYADGGRRPAG